MLKAIIIIVLIIVFIVVTLAMLRRQGVVKGVVEGWEEEPSMCSLDEASVGEILSSMAKIRETLDALKDFPWPDPDKFTLLYALTVTRMEYLVDTYGEKLTMHEFLQMFMDTNVQKVLVYFESYHAGLLGDVMLELSNILMILESTWRAPCPVCNPLYIRQNMQRIDHEFSIYFANLFPSDLKLSDATKKRLIGLEIDMLAVTELVDVALQNRDLDSRGRLDAVMVDRALSRLDNGFVAVTSDTSLHVALGVRSLRDIKAFIYLKRTMVEDLKRCVVTPLFYAACNYKGPGMALSEGQFSAKELKDNYDLSEVGSFRVPPTHVVVLNMSNGDVVTYKNDRACVPANMRGNIVSVTVLPKTKKRSLVNA